MVLLYIIVMLIFVAWLLRRDLTALGQISYRGGWKLPLIVGGLFSLQWLVIVYWPGQTILQASIILCTQLGLLALVWLNRHVAGASLFALGIILNTGVMVANGGWMPVTPEAYQFVRPELTLEPSSRTPNNKSVLLPQKETALWYLSDIIPVSMFGQRSLISIGDIFLLLGVTCFIFKATPSKPKIPAGINFEFYL